MDQQETASDQVRQESIINQEALGKLFSEKLPIPYLALLATYISLLVAVTFNLIGIASHCASRLFNEGGISVATFLKMSLIDISSIVIAQIAFLIVAIPAMLLVKKLVENSEAKEPWRQEQKTRRAFYIIGIVILIFALLSAVIGFVQALLSAGLSDNPGMAILSAIVGGALVITAADTGLYILVNSYSRRNAAGVKTAIIGMIIAVVILVSYGLYTVYSSKSSSRDSNSLIESVEEMYKSNSPSSSSGGSLSW